MAIVNSSIDQDITELSVAQQRLAIHYDIASIMDEGLTIAEAMPRFLETICTHLGWSFGEVWSYNFEQDALVWQACWHKDSDQLQAFEATSRDLRFKKGEGLPGLVWDKAEPTWIDDILQYAGFVRNIATGEVGLHTAFACPLWVSGKIIGVINFFSQAIQAPDQGMIDTFGIIGIQLGNYCRRKQSEEQLQIWVEMFKNSGEAIMVTDRQGTILTVNEAFVRTSGYSAEEVVGQNPRMLKSDRHDRYFFQTMWSSLLETGYWQGEVWDRRKNGEIYPKWSTISRIKNDSNQITHFIATYNDISDRKATEKRIRYLAHFDSLTGLPNRTLFADKVTDAISHAKKNNLLLAVLFLDLDRFKTVNDSLGHTVGDQLLQMVAKNIQDCLRKSDTVSRMGGDEFVVLLPEVTDFRAVAAIAQKLSETIRRPMLLQDIELCVTASIGISLYPDNGSDQETLLKNADAAMYYVKENGQNPYHFFTKDLNKVISTKLLMENNVRRALENKEFILYYQPQISLLHNQLVGMEALIRWQKTEESLIPPSAFIPVAEETGLIVPLGDWVLREVCRQCQEWRAMKLPAISIAINISAIQFQQSDFCQKTLATVQEFGIDPACLEIEITEGVVMKNGVEAIQKMNFLRENGFKLSMDDFGTGYSSLNYLSRFPIDKLKVDQSFIRNMLSSPIDLAIVEAVIALGKNLKMKTIAEGVETKEEVAVLKNIGCDQIQGFYYAKPMPADQFVTWWRQRLSSI